MTRPRPRPKTKKYALISPVELVSSSWCSSSSPTAVTPVPAIGKTFQRPVRLTICPETVEASSRPSTIGSMCTPDMVGRDALHDLEERRQIGHRAEHREADDEADDGGRA